MIDHGALLGRQRIKGDDGHVRLHRQHGRLVDESRIFAQMNAVLQSKTLSSGATKCDKSHVCGELVDAQRRAKRRQAHAAVGLRRALAHGRNVVCKPQDVLRHCRAREHELLA